jgi:ubiquinol-cytochrome c reductase cytochrome b subunit
MLGEVCLYSFIILLLSGTFLTMFFVPAMGHTEYHGAYAPMNGVEMSEAFASTLRLSFDVRGGLLMRQVHHWAALLFVAAIAVHMFRVFFTGAFRKPREINWVIGSLFPLLAMGAGFTGYSLPDDMLSGNGLRIIDGIIKSIPVVGTYVSFFLFDGEFPGMAIIPRLFIIHVLLIPGVILALIGAHVGMVALHKHTQYPGPGRTNDNVVGFPLMPVYMAKAGGFFFIVFGDADLGDRGDQPGVELRPLRPLPRLGGYPARLVRRLDGRWSAADARPDGSDLPRLHTVAQRAGAGAAGARHHHRAAGLLPLPRSLGDRRPA